MQLNDISYRIRWVRETLKLSQTDVVKGTKISLASYSGRENGVRATHIEEYLVLAEYFNEKWKQRKSPIKFNGVTIKRITPMFIMFGVYED